MVNHGAILTGDYTSLVKMSANIGIYMTIRTEGPLNKLSCVFFVTHQMNARESEATLANLYRIESEV